MVAKLITAEAQLPLQVFPSFCLTCSVFYLLAPPPLSPTRLVLLGDSLSLAGFLSDSRF